MYGSYLENINNNLDLLSKKCKDSYDLERQIIELQKDNNLYRKRLNDVYQVFEEFINLNFNYDNKFIVLTKKPHVFYGSCLDDAKPIETIELNLNDTSILDELNERLEQINNECLHLDNTNYIHKAKIYRVMLEKQNPQNYEDDIIFKFCKKLLKEN